MSASIDVPTTSLQRTYRYLRLGIAGCAVVIVVAVLVASIQLGAVLPSISAYYYSPAQGAFVGALIAAGVGILALSGRGTERAVLDAAAAIAPVVALVPTRVTPGSIPGLDTACPPGVESCVPTEALPAIDTGVITYVVVGLIAVLAAVGIARAQGTLRASLPSLLIALGIVLTVGVTWGVARGVFDGTAHVLATGIFFALIATAALIGIRPVAGERDRSRAARIAFAVVGVTLAADVLALIAVAVLTEPTGPLFFTLELVALALFLAFWLLQSGRTWRSDDPAFVAGHRRADRG